MAEKDLIQFDELSEKEKAIVRCLNKLGKIEMRVNDILELSEEVESQILTPVIPETEDWDYKESFQKIWRRDIPLVKKHAEEAGISVHKPLRVLRNFVDSKI